MNRRTQLHNVTRAAPSGSIVVVDRSDAMHSSSFDDATARTRSNGRRRLTSDVCAKLATAAGVTPFVVEAVFDLARSSR